MNQMIVEVVKHLCDSDDSLDELILEEVLSSSSSDEDEIIEVAAAYSAIKKLNRVRLNLSRTASILTNSAEEFKASFGMLPETFEFLLSILGPALYTTKAISGRRPITAQKQLLLTLTVMANQDSYGSIRKRYEVGQATAVRSVRRVCRNLCSMASRFIQWPVGETALDVMQQFEKSTGLPRVLGVIDGTNVRFTPNLRQGSTKMGNNFIHVQAVCDHNLLFTNVFTSTADPIHDAKVFEKSPLKECIETPDIYFPDDSYLVGDEAFGVHPNLMVPFADTGHLSPKQKEFNSRMSLARSVIDQTIAMWKGRWRSVSKRLPMVKIDKIPEYIIATCVLHNICIMRKDLIPCEVIPRQRNRGRLILGCRTEGATKRYLIMNSLDIPES